MSYNNKTSVFIMSIIFFIMLECFVSCNKDSEGVLVSGEVENVDELDRLIIERIWDLISVDTLIINKSGGSFRKRVKLEKGLYYIKYRIEQNDIRYPIYIGEGNTLNFTFDKENVYKTISFNGTGAPENNYLSEKSKLITGFFGEEEWLKIYSKKDKKFLEQNEELNHKLLDLLDSFPNLDEAFKQFERREINFYLLKELGEYNLLRSMGLIKTNQDHSTKFDSIVKNVNLTYNEDYKFSLSYQQLVKRRLDNILNKMFNEGFVEDDMVYAKALEKFPKGSIKQHYLFIGTKYAMAHTKDKKSYYENYLKICEDSLYSREITNIYNNVTALSKGNKTPVFNNYKSQEGKYVSLEDFKGKFLLIDVWATWCGPCIQEFPSLKAIQEQFRGKNIEFISISIDKKKDYKKWESFIRKNNLEGIQLIADKDWNSDFIKSYGIMTIPRFIIIDPKGNIINSNAPKPSSKQLIEILHSLLI